MKHSPLRHTSPPLQTTFCAILLSALTGMTAAGQILVLNRASGTVGEYSLTGEPINTTLISGLLDPYGMAYNDGFIYISVGTAVRQYTASGQLVNASLLTDHRRPHGLLVSGGYLYVSYPDIYVDNGFYPGTVGKYTTSGQTVNGSLISGISNPFGFAVDGEYLYAASWDGGFVGKFTTSGLAVNPHLIGYLWNGSEVVYPGGIVAGGDGNLFVSTGFDGVKLYTTSGVLLNGQLTPPGYNIGLGLALDGDGHLLVANSYDGPGGNFISQYAVSGELVNPAFITGLHYPVAIVVMPEPAPTILILVCLPLLLVRRLAKPQQVRRLPGSVMR